MTHARVTPPNTLGRPRRNLRRVADVMRTHFIVTEPDRTLEEAYQLMRLARLRHLLVAREEILLGVLSYRDLLESLLYGDQAGRIPPEGAMFELDRVESVMRAPVDVVTPEDTLADAARRLDRLQIGCLPVVLNEDEDTRLVGLVTASDLLRAAYEPAPQTQGWSRR